MQKIKTFLRSFWLSCTSPKYYAEILRTRFSFSLKYLFVFQFVATLIIGAFVLIPLSAVNVVGLLENVRAIYPAELAVQVDDGRLSINQPLPYKVAIPDFSNQLGSKDWDIEDSDVRYLVVFDSDENIQGASDVYDQDAFAVVTETTVYTRDGESDGLRVNSIPEDETFTVNEEMVNDGFNKVTGSPFIQQKLYIPLVAVILLLIILPLMLLGSLIMVAIYGFFVWLMARILKNWMMAGQVLSYTKAVQVSIHSLTLVNVVHFGLGLIGEGEIISGGKFFLAFLVWTGFVLYQSLHTRTGRPAVVKSVAPKATVKSKAVATKSPAKKVVKSKK